MAAAVCAIWLALYKAPQWALRARIRARLDRLPLDEDEKLTSLLQHWMDRFTRHRWIAADFSEQGVALETAGLSLSRAQRVYLLVCWLVPALVIAGGFAAFGSGGGLLIAGLAFVLPRKAIRTAGRRAEYEQNLEAIELCQMTRMLMEAGLSVERTLRLVATQARPVMPRLVMRLDRFNRMMESGAERTAALDELGRNKRITVLRNYVTLMKQSSKLGARVSDSLGQIVQEAQHAERTRLKEDTNRLGAKMTVIMMIFMLPALFILIGGPALISIADAMGGS
ncbi:type II secretion system F family protein [Marinobacter halodurans]|uniref:Type II secretion system F family protein n=2 Tax=Marinobacter halodurans TaxID=2528979 RepID=A0ABY1ZHI8_9GAMM|nr:type II secretion system F family protein [Marinobacter halodurans]